MLMLPTKSARFIMPALAVVGGLWLTGWISATVGGAPRLRAILRSVVMGSATMAATYIIGLLFGVAIN